MNDQIEQSFTRLQQFLEAGPLDTRYKGYDPFDGLNSKLFDRSPLKRSRFARLAWLQFNKKSPIDFRKLTGTKIGYNPQALGLFLSTYCLLYNSDKKEYYLRIIKFLSDKLLESSTKGYSGHCWGYNFDWQARAFFQPKNTPMIVPTSFAVDGLLSSFDVLNESKYLDAAVSSADFVMKDLNRTYEDDLFAFSYSPIDQTVVYNASLLASKLLGRIYHITKDDSLKEEGQKSVDFCVKYQGKNGSWTYGSKPYHQWIDNFHSGYNLVCLKDFKDSANGNVSETILERGMKFYLETFFTADGVSKYYHNKDYPLDINNPAQLIITLDQFGILNDQNKLAESVLMWAINNMQNSKGYFYYQKKRFYKIRIPYMRWSQAWMFYALTTYLIGDQEK